MRYATLVDGNLIFAPNPINVNGDYVGNPDAATHAAQGYKPVQFTDPPEAPAGFHYEPTWTETEDEIVQGWELVEEPITEDEALVRYSNELTGASDETLTEATETLIKIVKEENQNAVPRH